MVMFNVDQSGFIAGSRIQSARAAVSLSGYNYYRASMGVHTVLLVLKYNANIGGGGGGRDAQIWTKGTD